MYNPTLNIAIDVPANIKAFSSNLIYNNVKKLTNNN